MSNKKNNVEAEYQKSLEAQIFADDTENSVWKQEVKAWVDLQTVKNMYFNDDWVYILVDIFASKISALELKVCSSKNESQSYFHNLNDRLYSPNRYQTYHEFMSCVVTDLVLTGNAICYRTVENELIHIPVETIQMTSDDKGLHYKIVSDQDNLGIKKITTNLDVKRLSHMKLPNPSSAIWGLSPFVPGRKAVLFNRHTQEYLNNFYIKGAQPGLVLSMPPGSGARQEQALRMLRSMEISHAGRKNQRRNLILPEGMRADTISHSLADQQLKDYIELNRETIINLLKVPKHELSIAEAGSLGSEEHKIALRNFWAGPLKSKMKLIESGLSRLFSDVLKKEEYLEFDTSSVEYLQSDLQAKADLAESLLSTHTVDEIRAMLFNLPPLPETNRTPEVAELSKSANADILQAIREKFIKREIKLKSSEDELADGLTEAVDQILAEQAEAVIQAISPLLEERGLQKAQGPTKTEFKKEVRRALGQFENGWLESGQSYLYTSVETGYDSNIDAVFNLPNEGELRAVRDRKAAARMASADDRMFTTFENINKTSTNRIMGVIEEGSESSWSIGRIADEISNAVRGLDRKRAETIARTELLTATSIGQAAQIADAAEVLGDVYKIWMNAGDSRVRGNPGGLYPDSEADHWVLEGEIVKHNKKFSNGLKHPRDPGGQASEVINCRCTVLPISLQDLEALGLEVSDG